MEEIWKDIIGYEGYYTISNTGIIKSKSGHIKKPVKRKDGYYNIKLSIKYAYKMFLLHRLLAEHFIPNPNVYKFINHKDCNRSNTDLNNLEWCTASMNNKHRFIMNRWNNIGENNPRCKIDRYIARNIKNLFIEGCSYKEVMFVYPNLTRNCIHLIKNGHTWKHV